MARTQQAWSDVIAELEAERQKGTDPADPNAQALAARWQALIEQFTGGDAGIRHSLQRMYERKDPETVSRGAVSRDLMG